MAMLVVDGRGNDTHGLWLASDFHRFKEREMVGQQQNRTKEY